MKSVFIVFSEADTPNNILGVFATQQEAKLFILKTPAEFTHYWYSVEWELGKETPVKGSYLSNQAIRAQV